MKEDPPKRKRSRPAKLQDLHKPYGSDKKAKRPKAGSLVKVTKAKPKIGRPIAPSSHKMCTRARGPAENIPRF